MIGTSSAATRSLSPIGVWLHDNKRIQVEIGPCGDRLCGKIVWLKFPNDAHGEPRTDSKNPDPNLRTRPIMGLTVIRGLHHDSEHTWTAGEIYNPDDGNTYSSNITMRDNAALQVRAFVLLPLLGETQIWTRVEHDQTDHKRLYIMSP